VTVRPLQRSVPCRQTENPTTHILSRAVPTHTIRRPARAIYWICLLLICSAYIQGGLVKALDFPAAVAEMRHFGLAPAAPLALATIVGELVASS